jgi:hypothetical protein
MAELEVSKRNVQNAEVPGKMPRLAGFGETPKKG